MQKLTDYIEIHRTHDSVSALMMVSDCICPTWMKTKLQKLIDECFERLPAVVTFVVDEEEAENAPR